MKSWRFTVAFALGAATCPQSSHAQPVFVCSLGPTGGYDARYDINAAHDALVIARDVADALCNGVCSVTLVGNPTAGNALTFALPDGVAKVAYSPQFLQAVSTAYGDQAVFGILAHEVGHVIDIRHPSLPTWLDSSWGREVRADAWAGCALAKKRLSGKALDGVLAAIAAYPSPSHPAWDVRIPAVRAGFVGCGGSSSAIRPPANSNNSAGKQSGQTPPPPPPPPPMPLPDSQAFCAQLATIVNALPTLGALKGDSLGQSRYRSTAKLDGAWRCRVYDSSAPIHACLMSREPNEIDDCDPLRRRHAGVSKLLQACLSDWSSKTLTRSDGVLVTQESRPGAEVSLFLSDSGGGMCSLELDVTSATP